MVAAVSAVTVSERAVRVEVMLAGVGRVVIAAVGGGTRWSWGDARWGEVTWGFGAKLVILCTEQSKAWGIELSRGKRQEIC